MTISGRCRRTTSAIAARSGRPYSSVPSGKPRNSTSSTPTIRADSTCSCLADRLALVGRQPVDAGLAAGDHHVADLLALPGPAGDRCGGAELHVVGVGHDRERPASSPRAAASRGWRLLLGHVVLLSPSRSRTGVRRACHAAEPTWPRHLRPHDVVGQGQQISGRDLMRILSLAAQRRRHGHADHRRACRREQPSRPTRCRTTSCRTPIVGGAQDDQPGANDWDCKPSKQHPRPVVLVHGLMGNKSTNWPTYAPLLANEGYCVFALTYGQQPVPGNEKFGGLGPMQDERGAAQGVRRQGAEGDRCPRGRPGRPLRGHPDAELLREVPRRRTGT